MGIHWGWDPSIVVSGLGCWRTWWPQLPSRSSLAAGPSGPVRSTCCSIDRWYLAKSLMISMPASRDVGSWEDHGKSRLTCRTGLALVASRFGSGSDGTAPRPGGPPPWRPPGAIAGTALGSSPTRPVHRPYVRPPRAHGLLISLMFSMVPSYDARCCFPGRRSSPVRFPGWPLSWPRSAARLSTGLS